MGPRKRRSVAPQYLFLGSEGTYLPNLPVSRRKSQDPPSSWELGPVDFDCKMFNSGGLFSLCYFLF